MNNSPCYHSISFTNVSLLSISLQYLMELGVMDDTTSSLYWAVWNGDVALIHFFVEQGAMLHGALHAACKSFGCDSNISVTLTTISYLLEQGADINGYYYDNERSDESTPLFSAIQQCFSQDIMTVIKYLIMWGANIQLPSRLGKTPFHAAVERSCYMFSAPLLKYLHEQGVDINKVDNDQVSPLQHALEVSHRNQHHKLMTVRFLVEHGADVNHAKTNPNQFVRKDHGDSPLVLACRKRYVEICRLLVDHGADVNQVLTCHHD